MILASPHTYTYTRHVIQVKIWSKQPSPRPSRLREDWTLVHSKNNSHMNLSSTHTYTYIHIHLAPHSNQKLVQNTATKTLSVLRGSVSSAFQKKLQHMNLACPHTYTYTRHLILVKIRSKQPPPRPSR